LKQGRFIASLTALALVAPCAPAHAAAVALPRPDHVVVVVMENHDRSEIIGSPDAPYISGLAAQGVDFLDSHGVTHPSQPNYLALFSGSTQGVTSNACPQTFSAPSLGGALLAAGFSFAGYAEGMPIDGFTGCSSGPYERKHAPWTNFTDVPAIASRSFASFPADYAALPTVAFVTPNMCNDMHNCSVATGDAWLRQTFDGYVHWAQTHNSLFILTWDENDRSAGNQIPTIMVGAAVSPGPSSVPITHYDVLRTIEDMYGLPDLGDSATAAPIAGVWSPSAATSAEPGAAHGGGAPSAQTHGNASGTHAGTFKPVSRQCVVPRVRGLLPAAARHKLRVAGCRPGGATSVQSRVKPGHVAGSRPRAGAIRPAGSRVTLLVRRAQRRNADRGSGSRNQAARSLPGSGSAK
jgi:hypothetical protein